jgi:hypothetical protein
LLTLQEIALHLRDAGLLDPADVTDGNLVIRDVSRRNRNFRVEGPTRPLLLKQGVDPESRATVRHEGKIVAALGSHPRSAPYVPEVVRFDEDTGLLALGLITPALTFDDYHRRHRRGPAVVGTALGRALADVHLGGRAAVPAALDGLVPEQSYRLHRPGLTAFRTCSAGQLAVLRVIQASEGIPEAIDGLSRAEVAPATLLHGDVKWDNLLLVRPGRRLEVRLVDWEAAAWGSPLWDAGAVIASFLTWWLRSIPILAGEGPAQLTRLAEVPLERIRPTIQAFWTTYLRRSGPAIGQAHEASLWASRFAGYRLLVAAYEQAQATERLFSTTVLHLQLGCNLLLRPVDGAARLLGITKQMSAR